MTAIVYLGEILVASLLAIVLLAISHFRVSGGTALFVGGVVGWTVAVRISIIAWMKCEIRHGKPGGYSSFLLRGQSARIERPGNPSLVLPLASNSLFCSPPGPFSLEMLRLRIFITAAQHTK
jgi:hypothetical protein